MLLISLYLQKDDDSGTKNVEIIVPTKYVSNSWNAFNLLWN